MLCDHNAADIHGSDYYSVVFRLHFRRQSRIATLLLRTLLSPVARHANTMVIREGIQDARFNTTSLEKEEEGMDILGGRLFLHDFSPSLPRMLDRITN